MYREQDIEHETENFWVLNVGKRGFEVYRKGTTHSTRCAQIGNGPGPNLGIERAIAECNRREAELLTA